MPSPKIHPQSQGSFRLNRILWKGRLEGPNNPKSATWSQGPQTRINNKTTGEKELRRSPGSRGSP